MQREFCEVVTMSEAQAKCPWAAEIAEVEGGFLAFESMDDYSTWAKALSDNCGGDDCCGCEVCTPDDANTPSGVVGEHIEWTNDTGHHRRDIEVTQEALDIQPTDKTTVAYLMFQELDLEASDRYYFLECPWDSPVGYECMKVLRKAREFADMLHDLDSHQDIWSAAFEQCDIFYCG